MKAVVLLLCAVSACAALSVSSPDARFAEADVQVESSELARLRVAAAERATSLADRIAEDMEAEMAAREEAAAEDEAEVDTADAAEVDADADADTDAALSFEALSALEFVSRDGTGSTRAKTLIGSATKWSSCQTDADKATGATALSAVSFQTLPPMRTSSFLVNVDGKYTGPDVSAGSVTVQIARNERAGPVLVYRHSVRLEDVLGHHPTLPFRASDPFTTALYIPSTAFSIMAKEGPHTLTAVFTNQDKRPFACARIDFTLA